jgi:hypothetical protein
MNASAVIQAFASFQTTKRKTSMKVHLLMALILISVWTVQAADVSGTWEGAMETPFGDMDNTIILKFDAQKQKLTGRVKSDMFDEKIKNATFKDDTVAFSIDMGFGMTISYEGTLSENQLKLKVISPDRQASEMICTRKAIPLKKK